MSSSSGRLAQLSTLILSTAVDTPVGLHGEVVQGCFALRGVNTFVFAFLYDFDDLVVTGLF